MNKFLWTNESVKRNLLSQKYEPVQPFVFLSLLEHIDADVVFDVGANVGLYSLTSTLSSSVKNVFAFEPDETAFSHLTRNIELNSSASVVKAYAKAVSDEDGIVRFGSQAPMSGVNGVIDTTIHGIDIFDSVINVPAIKLDSFTSFFGSVVALKVDVEGHEATVLHGARKLLLSSPAVIQIEHYVGSGVDEILTELGYFCFFKAGYDHYFSNISNLTSANFVKNLLEHANTWLIETQSGRWPDVNTIQNSLIISYLREEQHLIIKAKVKDGFFSGSVEFAFYLIVDEEKVKTQWYSEHKSFIFSEPENASSVVVKVFVREASNPHKKVIDSVILKCAKSAYKAPSAVPESFGSPSGLIGVGNSYISNGSPYSEVDLTDVINDVNNSDKTSFIVLGLDVNSAPNIDKYLRSAVDLFTFSSALQFQGLKKDSFRYGFTKGLDKTFCIHNARELFKSLQSVKDEFNRKCVVLFRTQFFDELGMNYSDIECLFDFIPQSGVIYIDKLSNFSYCKKIRGLNLSTSLELKLVPPLSNIVPAPFNHVEMRGEYISLSKHGSEIGSQFFKDLRFSVDDKS